MLLTWTLRGGVSIELALSLPANPYRGRMIVVCYAVVVASTLVQGLTMRRAIRWLYGSQADAGGETSSINSLAPERSTFG